MLRCAEKGEKEREILRIDKDSDREREVVATSRWLRDDGMIMMDSHVNTAATTTTTEVPYSAVQDNQRDPPRSRGVVP